MIKLGRSGSHFYFREDQTFMKTVPKIVHHIWSHPKMFRNILKRAEINWILKWLLFVLKRLVWLIWIFYLISRIYTTSQLESICALIHNNWETKYMGLNPSKIPWLKLTVESRDSTLVCSCLPFLHYLWWSVLLPKAVFPEV